MIVPRPTPLDPPAPDSPVLAAFVEGFGIDRNQPPDALLEAVARAFATIPYENLTKILKHAACGSPEAARRAPEEVVGDHLALGTGGTCFSLTAALLHVVRALGFAAEPILADRPYGQDTHCALVVRVGGEPCLLDPGYLLVRPVPLRPALARVGAGETRVATDFNDVLLLPAGGGRLDLHTVQDGRRVARLSFRLEPADPGRFLRAWDASFEWDMMRYPLLATVRGGAQAYLQGRRLQHRGRSGVRKEEVPAERLPETVASEFGVSPDVVRRALEVLARRGEPR